MSLPASPLLEPATLAGIKDLHLIARTVVEGFLSGLHLDPRPSAGVEFSQYRSYEPGDDLLEPQPPRQHERHEGGRENIGGNSAAGCRACDHLLH